MNNLTFTVHNLNFNIQNLIGKDKSNKEVTRLIDHAKAVDDACEVITPMEEDIRYDNDRWEIYTSCNEGLVFELLNGKLIYISFELGLIDKGKIKLSDDIQSFYAKDRLVLSGYYSRRDGYYQRALEENMVIGMVENEKQKGEIEFISFGDYETFTVEENLPNRYSDVLGSLILA